jgi:hypothetical protein
LKFRGEKLTFLLRLCYIRVFASHQQLRLSFTAALHSSVRPSPEFNHHCFLLLPLHDFIQYIQSYTTIHTEGVADYLHSFSNPVLDESDWFASTPGRFKLRKKPRNSLHRRLCAVKFRGLVIIWSDLAPSLNILYTMSKFDIQRTVRRDIFL